ncbi:hypothetical protein R1sor_008363 [Riccia sorocarpa]|uniref:Uncharacterized protein n=1 Tax=Riccia sorocarpa TaxID=122646 RepID=A0ABD3HT65_9MARC
MDTGGVFAYTRDGCLKEEFLQYEMDMAQDEEKQVVFYGDWSSEKGLKVEEALCLDATFSGNVPSFINLCYFLFMLQVTIWESAAADGDGARVWSPNQSQSNGKDLGTKVAAPVETCGRDNSGNEASGMDGKLAVKRNPLRGSYLKLR